MKHVTFSSLNSWTWLLSQQCMHPIGKWRIWQYQGFCQAVCMYCLLKSIMDYTTSCEFFNCRNKIVTLLTEQNQSLGIPPFCCLNLQFYTLPNDNALQKVSPYSSLSMCKERINLSEWNIPKYCSSLRSRAEKSFIKGEKLFTKRKFDHFSADDSRPTMEKDKDKQKL